MTPAVKAAERAGISITLHEYAHDPNNTAFGLEAAEALGLDPKSVFKTLLVALDADHRRLAVAVVPVAGQLDLKAMATACRVKRVEMADPAQAQRATGYLVGGISPIGQKKKLPTVVDQTAAGFEKIYVSGGRPGLDIGNVPDDLLAICSASWAPIGR